jgi:predicted benzoate:H+ symporter BenE
LLREYVDNRIEMLATRQISQGLRRSEELQATLWTHAKNAAEKSPGSIMTGLYIQSLNQMIDVHAKRVMVGLRSRVPLSIWGALFALALLGMLSMGYQAGLSATRRSPAEMAMALAIAGVLFLIVDLDRAHEGLLAVGQGAMTDLQKSMHTSSHP